jgi:phosphoesterase RecJ-like protein
MLTHEMLEKAGASSADTEGLIDYPRSIAGVDAVALLRQVEDEKFKVSLRSRGDIDVEKIARKRGGGGHKNAAGFLIEDNAQAALKEVVSALEAVLE